VLVVGLNGKLFGLERATGEPRWSFELPGWQRGEVFLAIRYGLVVASSHVDSISALDYLTGTLRWTSATTQSGRATIVVEHDVIVCAKNGYLDCYDHQGARRWAQPLSGQGLGRAALGFPGNVAQADDVGR